MSQFPPRYVAAAVQARPVFLDCSASHRDGLLLGPPVLSLLAVAFHDEEGVIDADSQSNHDDHDGDDLVDGDDVGRERRQPRRHDNRDDAKQEWHGGSNECTEDNHEHHAGHRKADRQVLGQDLLGDCPSGFVNAEVADRVDVELGSGLTPRNGDKRLRLVIKRITVIAHQRYRHDCRVAVFRDQCVGFRCTGGLGLIVVGR